MTTSTSTPPKTQHAWNRLFPSLGEFAANKANQMAIDAMPNHLKVLLEEDPSPETDAEAYQATLSATTQWLNNYVATQMKTPTGEAAYTADLLKIYDAMVWRHNSAFHWRMQQEEAQGLYNDCLLDSSRHCEIAVGTGLFLAELDTVRCGANLKHITLLDLQKSALEACENRLMGHEFYRDHIKIESMLANILDKPPKSLEGTFDTVAANFLVHCLPSGDDVIPTTFAHCASLLRSSPSSTFFGSTILGRELLDDKKAGKASLDAIAWYNEVGVFGNEQHCFKDISSSLHDLFDEVEVWRVGYCAVWKARGPKHQPKTE